MKRLRRWLAATHGQQFELVRHFLGRFFDSDLVTSPDQWAKTAAGVAAVLISASILMVPVFVHRYGCLESGVPSRFCPAVDDYRAQYLALVRADTLWLIGLAFCVTALATALEWQSLFPTLRDCLALASYPVSARQIFWSKLAAACVAFAGFVLAMNALPAAWFAHIIEGRWQQHSFGAQAGMTFAAATAACVFVFFAMLALQGLLLNLLPPRLFERVSTHVQTALFTAGVAALPFLWNQPAAAWWPPNWFLAMWSAMFAGPSFGGAADPRPAICALVGAPLAAILMYLLSYHRYQRLLIEAPAGGPAGRLPWPSWLTWRDPREQAMFSFLWKTLTRSRLHRLALEVCAGLAIAWMIGAGGLGERDAAPVVLIPLAVSVFLIAGLRYVFSIPSELRANWMFQAAESEGRLAWLRAVDRFVIACVLAPVYVCTMPAAIAVFGWQPAVRVSVLGFFLALLVYEFLFRDWRKAPFTCSYLPGKRQLWQILLAGMGALSYLGTAAAAILTFGGGWVPFVAAFPLLYGAWRWMHRRRTEHWPETPLLYDEQPEPAVSSLNIDFQRGSLDAVAPAAAAPSALNTPFWNAPLEEDRDATPFFRPAGLGEDLRYGLRLLRKNFVLALTIVATLTLGIGMNVSVFTLLNALAFRPRVPDPASFVRVSPVHAGEGLSPVGGVTSDEYLAYRERARSLRSLAASFRTSVALENDRSSTVPTLLVSCNFFAVFGADRPRLGRFFRADECAVPGQATVAVLAEETWRDRFGADPAILGRSIAIDDQRFTIVGVAPAATAARSNGVALWLPYTTQPVLDLGFEAFRKPRSWLSLDGRLKPGVSRAAVEAELSVLARQLDAAQPGRKTTLTVSDGSLFSMLDIMTRAGAGPVMGYWTMLFLMLALGMVLCITCANVMTLLLSRAVSRRKEIAIRLSLGAPRPRLLRMLLVEGFLLAAAAGGISLWASYKVPGVLFAFLAGQPADFPLAPDWRIFLYVFGVALAAGCLSALAPALESLKVDLTASLKDIASAAGGTSGARLRTALVASQVALSLTLLVGAGKFLEAYWRMNRAHSGYDPRHVLAAPLRFPGGFTAARSLLLGQEAVARIEALPGVSSVARANDLPLMGTRLLAARFQDRGIETARTLSFQPGAPDLLRTLDIPLLRGRDFRASDGPFNGAPARAIVSQRLAREMSPNADPVGRVLETLQGVSYEIIGVARDVRFPLSDDPVVYTFDGWNRREAFFLVRFSGDPRQVEEAVRTAIRGLRGDLLVTPRTLQSYIDDSLADTWRVVLLILLLGVVAMTLAVAGIYGIISFTVSQKTRELGIRMALGAQKRDIFREVLVSGGRPVLLGLFVGLWMALAADSAIRHIFHHSPVLLDAADPRVFLGSALVLGVAALAAMLVPARRGAGGDPLTALHYE